MIRYALRCEKAHRFEFLVRIERRLRPSAGRRHGRLRGLRQRDDREGPDGPRASPARRPRPRSPPPPPRPSRRSPSSAAASRRPPRTSAATSPARRAPSTTARARSARSSARPPPPRRARCTRTASRSPGCPGPRPSPTDHFPRPRARLGSAKRGTRMIDLPSPRPRRHHRRRHLRLLRRLPPGRARLDRRGAARAQAAHLRHHLARGRARRPAAGEPEPDPPREILRRPLRAARGGDRPRHRLPPDAARSPWR